jgi:hypothetical protein
MKHAEMILHSNGGPKNPTAVSLISSKALYLNVCEIVEKSNFPITLYESTPPLVFSSLPCFSCVE